MVDIELPINKRLVSDETWKCDTEYTKYWTSSIRIIENDESLKLVGECGDGISALKLIKRHQPDIAILDISLPGKSGLDVVNQMKLEKLTTKSIILTMYNDEEYLYEAMDIGIKGYLLKENTKEDLPICIKAVISGNYYITPLLSDYLINYTKNNFYKDFQASEVSKLSKTERKVLSLIAENKTHKEIAKELYLNYRTVQNHCQHINNKLNLHGRKTLNQFAVKNKGFFGIF